ncbi:MAG: DUF2956 domain-containing protein [Gammaproteobacteria bacterium]|nr:DUF2956 domain-containing protein [Gammaproteobacteria bacterium]
MAKYNKAHQASAETIDESNKMAKSIQKTGQTKEQTKLIAQGIQKGIEQYKKQHKAKMREQDKVKKKHVAQQQQERDITPELENVPSAKLPWILLGLSWAGFGVALALLS